MESKLLEHCVICPHYNSGEGDNQCLMCEHVQRLTSDIGRQKDRPELKYVSNIDVIASTENQIEHTVGRLTLGILLQEYCEKEEATRIVNATIFLQRYFLGLQLSKIARIYNIAEKTVQRKIRSVLDFLGATVLHLTDEKK